MIVGYSYAAVKNCIHFVIIAEMEEIAGHIIEVSFNGTVVAGCQYIIGFPEFLRHGVMVTVSLEGGTPTMCGADLCIHDAFRASNDRGGGRCGIFR